MMPARKILGEQAPLDRAQARPPTKRPIPLRRPATETDATELEQPSIAVRLGRAGRSVVPPPGSPRPGATLRPTAVARPANHDAAGPVPAARPSVAVPASRPLPPALQARLAPIVGPRAVAAARVHTGPAAHARARAHDAKALALGEDIFFADGRYEPGTRAGDALIAHEVAHVAQAQRGLLRGPGRKAMRDPDDSPLELAADRVAEDIAGPEADEDLLAKAKRVLAGAGPTADGAPAGRPQLTVVPPQPVDGEPAAVGTAPVGGEPLTADGLPGAPDAAEGAGPAAEGDEAARPALALVPAGLPLMPAPATTLSTAEKQRIGGVQRSAKAHVRSAKTAPEPKENVSTAQAAVKVPQTESDARAAQEVVAALAKQAPSVEIEALCKRIKALILSKRPADEDAVIDTRPQEVAQAAGEQVEGDVDKKVEDANASYKDMGQKPAGPLTATPPGIEPLPGTVGGPAVNAASAVPDPVAPQAVSLEGDKAKMDEQATNAGLGKETAQLVQDGPIADARDAQGEMGGLAQNGPDQVLKQQQDALAGADANMLALQAKALASLKAARTGHVGKVKGQQTDLKGGEEGLRKDLADRADKVFLKAQSDVRDLLKPVHDVAMDKWTKGLPLISKRFNDDLKVVKNRIEDRHSGVGGFFVAGWDAVTGLPGWATDAYDRAERNYGDDVCTLITNISKDVNYVIGLADGIIKAARDEIHGIFTKDLPKGLEGWAAEQEKGFGKKLDRLHDEAEKTRTDFNKELIENAGNAVQAARAQIQKLREEAGGLWGRFTNALRKFLDDPLKFIIEGLLSLLGIPPPAFWAVVAKIQKVVSDIVDAPLRFAQNLLAGIGQGFTLFFDNIARHLLEGLLEWLLSGMKDVGVAIEVPKELSLKSVISFFLQLLGISWARIRKLLVEQLGEKAVAMIEKSAGVISTLAKKGITGIWEDIKKMIDPKTILDTILEAAIKYISETLIVKVAQRIILMLNPVGAILAALEAIYRVLKWIFFNAAKIFHLIEAVVNGMADVIAGNIGGVAKTVQKALAMLVAPVIDFLADYLGLGGLPGKVANAVKGLQGWVEGILRSVITWLVGVGRKLLATLGFGGKDGKKDERAVGDIGETLTFTDGDEVHHLYISVAGKGATVMVASAPMTLSGWLDELQTKRLTAVADEGQRKAASGLIAKARQQLAKTDADADSVARAQASDAPASAASVSETKVNADEEALRDTLDELGKIFGARVVVKTLKVPSIAKVSGLGDSLVTSIEASESGKTVHSEPTGPNFVKTLLAQRHGKASFDGASGTLSLQEAPASALAAADSTTTMGEAAASATGVAAVRIIKRPKDLSLIGAIDEVKATLATADVPPFKPIDKAAQMSGGQERVRIIESDGTARLVEGTGSAIVELLTKTLSSTMVGARNAAGPTLIAGVGKQLLGFDTKLRATSVTGWLDAGIRQGMVEAGDQAVTAVTQIGAEAGVGSLERLMRLERRSQSTVEFNMEIPGAVAGNPSYVARFEGEVNRQLKDQETSMNAFTVDIWVANIDTYKASQNSWIGKLSSAALSAVVDEVLRRIDETSSQAQRVANELKVAQASAAKIKIKLKAGAIYTPAQALAELSSNEYIVNRFTGRYGNEVAFREEHADGIAEVFNNLQLRNVGLESRSGKLRDAVLHTPDQIAGGFGMLPDLAKAQRPGPGEDSAAWDAYLALLERYVGASKINSRIGPGWAAQIEGLYTKVKGETKEAAYPLWLLNFTLSPKYQ